MSKRALIIGAGIGGLGAGLALRQAGWAVDMWEQAPSLAPIGAGIQLSPNACHILKNWGVLADVQATAFQPQAATLRHGHTGRTFMRLPCAQKMQATFGAPYLNVMRADLQAALQSHCQAVGARLRLNMPASSAGVADLAKDYDLVVGADGLRSQVLGHVCADAPALETTAHTAWRALVPVTPVLRARLAPEVTAWLLPGAHVVTYFVAGGTALNVVLVEEGQEHEAETNAPWGKQVPENQNGFQDAVARLGDLHPHLGAILASAKAAPIPATRWPLMQRAPVPRWTRGNVALLGDAAHPMLPFLAQGAAMALEDAAVLAKTLRAGGEPSAIVASLKTYAKARQPRTAQVQARAARQGQLYHLAGPLGRAKLEAGRLLYGGRRSLWPLRRLYGYRVR